MGLGGTVSGSTVSAKQQTLAAAMDTDVDGFTYAYKLTNTLNSYISTNNYAFYGGWTLSELAFRLIAFNSLSYDRAPILYAITENLPYYGGNLYYHYITVTDFDYTTMNMTLYDPHIDNRYYGIHSVSWQEAYNSISQRYLIGYYAGQI